MRFPRSKSYSIHIPPILGIFPTITLEACTVLHLSVLLFIYSLSVVRLMSTVLVYVFVRCPSVNYQILKDENNKSQWWQTDPKARPTMEEMINEIKPEAQGTV